MRLEWRKSRRTEHNGLTSHSWLEAHLVDGRELRLEFFADVGLMESVFEQNMKGDSNGEIYEGRVCGDHRDFIRPLTADRLRSTASEAASKPYSVTEHNCHQFVLEVWNSG